MSASISSLQATLATVVGEVRAAGPADAVAGVQPRVVAVPTNAEEVAALLALASREGLGVLPRGGGTQLAYGLPPRAGDILLDLRRLDQVIEYHPHDLTVSVQPGMPLATLQQVLGEQRQWLALDPLLLPGATIGGIISTNASGPRRLRFGGVRDQLIGIRVALSDGTLAKGGGKVVKNVAGYDLPKLYCGAHGTLGVIVEATFRVYPLPTVTRTVRVWATTPEPLCALVMRLLASPLVPSAIDIAGPAPEPSRFALLVRFDSGVAEAVRDQSESVRAWARGGELEAHVLDENGANAIWSSRLSALPFPANTLRASLKVSILPGDMASWFNKVQALLARGQIAAECRAHAGHGLIEVLMSGPPEPLVAGVNVLREDVVARRGSLVVTDAPPALLARLDPWGPVPALSVMRALKERFDPTGILNPGRFVGGL